MVGESLMAWLPQWTLLLTLAVVGIFLFWRSRYPPFTWGETVGPVPNALLVPILSVGALVFATGALQLGGEGEGGSWWGGWLGLLLTGLGVLSVTVFRRVEEFYPRPMRWLVLGLALCAGVATALWWLWWTWWLLWVLLALLLAYLAWVGSVVLVCGCPPSGGTPPTGGTPRCTVTITPSMTPVSGGPGVGGDFTRTFTFTAASSLGHPVMVVAVDSVETSVSRLSWSNMTTGGQTTTPGDPDDLVPETTVATRVSATDTGQRWVRIKTSYTCPTCGATGSNETEERIN